ncbi:Mini-chromosome maintenance protein 2 [Popillia japonica]|uniref:Mini-chromosome maintenance protein 2 n=1 Tax=Popillia japonica TaxID=7064 RepID=A0AAW1MPA9_POPJA
MPVGEDSSPIGTPSDRRQALTSPVQDFELFEDEGALFGDTSQADPIENEEDGEELFGDNMENDYRPMPGLDRYDIDNLDEEEYDIMSENDRRAAEEELRRRDREMGITRRDDRELFYDKSDEEEEPQHKRRRAEKGESYRW